MTRDLQDHQNEAMHECPECNKRSLARINESRFHCLSCRFNRDIDQVESEKKPDNLDRLMTGLMLFALSGLMVFTFMRPSVKTQDLMPVIITPQPSSTNEGR